MKPFTTGKEIRRIVTVRSPDRALPNRDWILGLGAEGVTMREAGRRGARRYRLAWKTVIGIALAHGMEIPADARAKARALTRARNGGE